MRGTYLPMNDRDLDELGLRPWVPPVPESGAPTALGCSIYAGGHAVGVAETGFRILGHLEEGTFGVATFMANFPRVPVWHPREQWPTGAYRGKVDWVYSNPPCAPWSQAGGTMSGGKDHWRNDPRVEHTLHSFELVERLRPKVWSWESVQRTYTVGADIVDDLTRQLLDLNYAVTHLLTDGQLHGLPQRRCRFFLIAHQVALTWPTPEVVPPTVAEALRGIEPDWYGEMPEEWRAVASVLPPGGYLRNRWEELHEISTGPGVRVVGRPPYTVHRIRADQVCSTITSMRSQVHPTENRYLANNELARLQGYPPGYRWTGPPATHQIQMAQAVTPAVARYLADVIRVGLARGAVAPAEVNVVDFRPLAAAHRNLNLPLTKGGSHGLAGATRGD
jgi:DNA (cytosine-5)-methyltransferase 1